MKQRSMHSGDYNTKEVVMGLDEQGDIQSAEQRESLTRSHIHTMPSSGGYWE